MTEFDKEKDFEDALVKMLTEKCGWSGGVLNHPTEADLLKNWSEIYRDYIPEESTFNIVWFMK